MYIAVSGNICSGKSTVVRIISEKFKYKVIPYDRPELAVLDNFYNNIETLFLATQSSFLINKAHQILNVLDKSSYVVDRNIYEDINVFARFWIENYNIPDLDIQTYKRLSDLIMAILPKPDIKVFCSCSLSTLLERYKKRERRSFEHKYPIGYIEKLNYLYQKDNYFSECFCLNTDCYDMQNPNAQQLLAQDIYSIINGKLSNLQILESHISNE